MFIRGTGEMADWLRDFVAVAQDPGPVPSTVVDAYKSPRGSDILFRPPWTLYDMMHTQTWANIHKHKTLML